MKFLFSITFLFLAFGLFAQRGTISGTVKDTTAVNLVGATVLLNNKVDSVLVSYDITDENGKFEILRIPKGDYYIQISSIGFEVKVKDVSITDGEANIAFGEMIMQVDARTNLDAILIEEAIPMRLEGDTISYNANAYNVDRSDNVENLLKKLPGVEVEDDGSITVMGKDVDKVQVDGKDFFGDDPTVATKNLPADAVDKVEVFDKKSERSEFTGVDDGQRSTTINLKLKPGKKSGYFGTVRAGGGTTDKYNSKANINRFTRDSQISTLGSLNNVNERSFTWRDYVNLSGGINAFGGGGRRISINSGQLGGQQGSGVNRSGTAGVNLNYFPTEKVDLHVDYFYNMNDNDYLRSLERQNFIDDGFYDYLENSNGFNQQGNHRANLNLDWKASKKTQIDFKNNLNFANSKQQAIANSTTFNLLNDLQNTLDNITDGAGDNVGFGNDVFLKQKFTKKGRSLFAEINYDYNNSDFDSDYLATAEFFNPNDVDDINQLLNSEEKETGIGGNLSWTEPLGNKQYVELRYDYRNSDNDSDKDYFDFIAGNYQPNTTLNNEYQKNLVRQNAGVYYRIAKEKHNITLGGSMRFDRLEGITDLSADNIDRKYNQFLPSFSWKYDITQSKNIGLNYTSDLRLPTVSQLQPVADSSNLINVYLGNPQLEAESRHNARINFFSFDRFTFTNVFAFANFTYTKDKITNSQTVDNQSVQTTQPVNVDNDFQANANLSFSRPIRALKTRVRLSSNLFYNNGSTFINGVESDVRRFNPSFRLGLSNTKDDKTDLNLNANWRFNNTKYSENTNLDQSYLTQRYSFDADQRFGKGWKLGSEFDYNVYSPETYGDENTFAIWEASLSKNILENDRGQLVLSFFDILNQNTGISRSSDYNYTQQEISNTIGQYGMLSFSYNLSRVGGKDSENTRLGQ